MAYIELPKCKGYYSSDPTDKSADNSFLDDVNQAITKQESEYKEFYAGLCYNCYGNNEPCGFARPSLQLCSGCQLVSYCSKECQKKDRSKHKIVCREFPVVDGKNVLYTNGSWKKHITHLQERAANIPHAPPIFRNPRVCNTCKNSRQDQIKDHICPCISYCRNNKKCWTDDKQHNDNVCIKLIRLSQYRVCNIPSTLPLLRDTTQCETFMPTTCWNDFIPANYYSILESAAEREDDNLVSFEVDLVKERFSYPMSLLYALQALLERRLISDSSPLEDWTSLSVHVVTSIPLFDSEAWEVFMHRLPKLMQLNIVFISQGRPFRQSFSLLTLSPMMCSRCDDCADKGRVMTISVKQKLYHMYYSSSEYTDPDVVVVYGNEHEMLAKEKNGLHSEISYRNMTNNSDIVLVLMDASKDQVRQGARAVHAAQPVEQLVPIQANPLCGPSSNRAEMDAESAIINEKAYFTCVRRK